MTMLSFRVPEDEAAETQRWAEALGVDRSELLRDALHRHLVALRPAEDWADWSDAPG
jgi:predicted transcriptional regulator